MSRYRRLSLVLLVLLALSGLHAGNHSAYVLPEDRGTAGTLAALEKLPVYVRVLHTTAHPDDESAGTLTWLSRKFHAQTALFCLTRGEGGQNILGKEKYEALGLVRTGELLEACRYYGAELYFGSELDFGFSKTAEETLSRWGHEAALEEMVRFIRWWRPTIIISKFQGDAGDGHGHHQAAGILTREAFRAAGDPQRFPEQIKNGIQRWQAKKLFVSSRGWGESSSGDGTDQLVRIPVGDYDPVLGRSYREIATEGYSKHRTQGDGAAYSLPGRAFENYRLEDSVMGYKKNADSFFDSIDTSLMALWELAGDEKQSVSFLKEDLNEIQRTAAEALGSFKVSSPEKSASAAARGARILGESIKKIEASSLSKTGKETLLSALNDKLRDFQKAVNALLGLKLIARVEDATAVPGEEEPVTLYLYNQGSEKIVVSKALLSVSKDKGTFTSSADQLEGKQLMGGNSISARLSFKISPGAGFTEPFWHLARSTDARYQILPTQNEFAPFGPPEIAAEVRYQYQENEFPVSATPMAQTGDALRGVDFIGLQIVPALSISISPDIEISPTRSETKPHEFQVSVLNNLKSGTQGTLKLVAPSEWQVDPGALRFNLTHKGETFTAKFVIRMPSREKQGRYPIEAVATTGNQEFRQGYNVISYPENWTRNLYSRAQSQIERFDIAIAPNLTVGYVPGAGDDIPAALEQIGIKSQILSAEDLAFSDLSRFSAIITGIRAYNTNEDLRTNNQRLLNYVAQGGTLIVQYVRPMGKPAAGGMVAPFLFGPYPMSVSESDRITVEDSPVRILDPENPVFNQPNKIAEDDFHDWVQERGLYFMDSWDKRYTALLSGNDPGETPQDGGMLYAQYGKGHYIYTGYSWFRQLPAGNPGAFRIFANMISLGKN